MFSDGDEKDLVLQIKANGCQAAFSKLKDRYDNLLNKLSWEYLRRYPYLPLEFEDFYNYSIYLLYRLTINYDLESSKSFPLYIKTFLKFHITNYIKKFQTKNNVLMNKMFPIIDDFYSKDNEEDYLLEDIENEINKFNFLTKLEKEILYSFIAGEKPEDIAKRLDKKTTSIYASFSRLRRKLIQFYNLK